MKKVNVDIDYKKIRKSEVNLHFLMYVYLKDSSNPQCEPESFKKGRKKNINP